MEFDDFDQIVSTTNATGGTNSTVYDDFGRAVSATDAAGLTTITSYNELDMVTSVTYPPVSSAASQPSTVQTVYDFANSQLIASIKDRSGLTTSYEYNARLARIRQTTANGGTSSATYDRLGRLASLTDALGNKTGYTYDQFDQRLEIVHPDNTTQSPRVTYYQYDAWGKMISETGSATYPISYTYDLTGNLATLTDGKGSTTTWYYDDHDRVSRKAYANGKDYEYTYDKVGNLVTRKDSLGRVTQYHYNAFDRLILIDYPFDADVSYTYNAQGHLTGMTDATGNTSWAWDSAGRNTGYTQGGVDQHISYNYNVEGLRTQREVLSPHAPPGLLPWITQYAHQNDGRLSSIKDSRVGSAYAFTYTYTSDAPWVTRRTNADGSQVQYQHDALGRLTNINATTASGGSINSFSYTHNSTGQRSQETANVATRTFTYDDKRQLSTAARVDSTGQALPDDNYSFQYDPIGNLTKETSLAGDRNFAANNLNQFTGITGTALAQPHNLQYDNNGSMTASGDGSTYSYDEEDRLVQVVSPNAADGNVKTINIYDGLNRRVEKQMRDVSDHIVSVTRYLYDGKLPIAEYNAAGDLSRSYTRGLDLSGSFQGSGGIGGLLALTDSNGSYSYFADANGNVTDLINNMGSIVSHLEYSPFGKVIASTGTLQQPYQWSSKECDESGLNYYLYRFYNPGLGRWQNRDPLAENGGVNLYASVLNNPIGNVDPFGEITASIVGKPVKRPAGGWGVWFRFVLDSPQPTDGYMVQKIVHEISLVTCHWKSWGLPAPTQTTFWEAWFIKAGTRLSTTETTFPSLAGVTDRSSKGSNPGTIGLQSSEGNIKWVPIGTSGDLGDPGDPTYPGNHRPPAAGTGFYKEGDWYHPPPSGFLPATYDLPTWWAAPGSGTEKDAYRLVQASWDDCCAPKMNVVIVKADRKTVVVK